MTWNHHNVGVLLLRLPVEDEAGRAGPSRGHFDFQLDPFVDRRSQRLGVRERVFRARVHQRGIFDYHDQLAARFVEGLRTSLAQMLQDPSIADRDRVYFSSGLRPPTPRL